MAVLFFIFLYFKDFIYLFLESGEGREIGREETITGLPLTDFNQGPDPQPRHVF